MATAFSHVALLHVWPTPASESSILAANGIKK